MRTTENTSTRRLASSDQIATVRLSTIVLLSALLLSLASTAAAVEYSGGIEGRVVSASAVAPSSASRVVYEVPPAATFVMTQACSDHTAVYVGGSDESLRFTYGNAGCTYFSPGVIVASGERLRCINKSGQARSCTIMGVIDANPAKSVRPKWIESKN